MISIKVPPLGESIVEATIARWLKKEGDVVAQNESLVELETDKITVEVPAFKAGVLTKQAKKEGDVVQVGEEIGAIDESASVATAAPATAPAAAPSAAPKTSPAVRRIAADEGIDPAQVAASGPGDRCGCSPISATLGTASTRSASTIAWTPRPTASSTSSPR